MLHRLKEMEHGSEKRATLVAREIAELREEGRLERQRRLQLQQVRILIVGGVVVRHARGTGIWRRREVMNNGRLIWCLRLRLWRGARKKARRSVGKPCRLEFRIFGTVFFLPIEMLEENLHRVPAGFWSYFTRLCGTTIVQALTNRKSA